MASRHEYEMLFQLSAKMGSGFAGTFSKAQQQILAIQKEVQELNQLQSDISAYQKQQAAVEATNKKLSVLQAQYDNIQREIQETEGFSSSLENKLLSKQHQIDKTSASLEKQTQKLNDMGQALQEAGIDTEHLEQESERLDASMTDLKETQEEVAESAEDFGDKSVNAFEAINDAIVAAGIVTALHEIYEAYAECITITGEFEDSLANVQALSGATAQEMGQLSDLAKELGATTQFTAKESADAMGYMAMAGWDAQQMISGMPGVLKLAAASGEDLAMVSDIVTDSMTAFGLTAADTAHYADVLAAAATSANTNVSLMGETFKYAAPMAGALGYTAEDVAIAVGMMANAGIKGSQAGTTLNNIFTRLAKPTKESADAMDALGISLLDGSGHMYTFMELMEIMRDRFAGLTETQKAFYAAELAGQQGMSGLLSIVNASESDFASLSESITGCAGAAERMAAIKLDTMNGQLTLAKSAAEALQTTIGEQFTPVLKGLYTEGANVMTEVNAFLQANPGVIKGVTAVAIGVGTMTAGITGFVAVTKIAVPLMTAFTAAIPGVGLILGVGAALTSLTAGMVLFSNEVDDTTYTAKEQQAELLRLREEYKNVCDTYGETSSEASALRYQINALSAEFEASGHSFNELFQDYRSIIKATRESSQAYQESMGKIHDESLDAMALGTELHRLSDSYTGTAGEAQMMGRIIEELNSRYEGLDLTLQEVTSGTYDWGKSLDAYIQQTVDAQERTEKLDRAVELLSEHRQLEISAEKFTEEIEAAEEALSRLSVTESDVGQSLFGGGNNQQVREWSEATSRLAALRTALEETNAALQANEDEYAAINEALGGTGEALSGTEEAGQRLQNIINVTASELDGLVEAYNKAYTTASESVRGQYEMWDEAAKVIPTSVEKMTQAMQGQIDYWQDYRENLEYLRDQAVNIEGLDQILNNLADGSQESVNAVAGIAGALRDGSGDVGAMVGAYQDLKSEQDKVSQSMADTATNFSQKLAEMQGNLEQAVRDMDVSDLAEESARSTIQGFINQADGMLDSVQAAYSRLGKAAADSLAQSFNNITANLKMPSLPSIPGYAVGTHYAEPGIHHVGERGAEMVFFGGERNVPSPQEIRRLREELVVLRRASPLLGEQEPYRRVSLTETGESGKPLPVQKSETIRTFERVTQEIRDRMPDAPDGMLVGTHGPELMYFTGGETVLTSNETKELQRETALLSRAITEQLISVETAKEFEAFTRTAQDIPAELPKGAESGAESLSFAFPSPGVYSHEGTPGKGRTNRERPGTGRDVFRESELIREALSERATAATKETRESSREIRELLRSREALREVERAAGGVQQAFLSLPASPQVEPYPHSEIGPHAPSAAIPQTSLAEAHLIRELFSERLLDSRSSTRERDSRDLRSFAHDDETFREIERFYREIPLLPGNASGTKATAPGAALVGAHGPELALFQGGEKVLTASETRELQRETDLLREALSEKSSLFGYSTASDSRSMLQTENSESEIIMELRDVDRIYRDSRTMFPFSVPGYASGTKAAAPGAALVGERGQELVLWGGPEKALDSKEIRELRESVALRRYATERTTSTRDLFSVRESLTDRTHDTAQLSAIREYSEAMRSEAVRELREIQRMTSVKDSVRESNSATNALFEAELMDSAGLMDGTTAKTVDAIRSEMKPPETTAILPPVWGNPLEAALPDMPVPSARNPLEAELDTVGGQWPEAGRGGGGSYSIMLSPSYNNYFNGATKPEDVESAMLSNTEHLREQVERILEDIEADRIRSDFR